MTASNNWAVSGKLTASGKPIYCSDPHLEVNRIPAIWQEIVLRLPDDVIMGASLPGVPGIAIGRSRHLAWGATYSFMDMIDYRVEECRDGRYRRGKQWKPFAVREELITVKKGEPVIEKVYENEHGVLEGDPFIEGHYLVMSWSAARGCGAGEFNGLLGLPHARSAREAMACFRKLEALSFNWVMADSLGNIAYQMSGRLYKRPKGVSGLVPLPGWEKKYTPRGFVSASLLPAAYKPPEGIIVTANQDLNRLGKAKPINLPMASYRADRIAQLLKKKKKLGVEDMKRIHFDLYSLQAERFMKVLRPLLPDTDNGRILREWECTYTPDSRGATLFESVYRALLRTVFGDNGMGREVVDWAMSETGLFNDYYGNFDEILMNRARPGSTAAPRRALQAGHKGGARGRAETVRQNAHGDALAPPLRRKAPPLPGVRLRAHLASRKQGDRAPGTDIQERRARNHLQPVVPHDRRPRREGDPHEHRRGKLRPALFALVHERHGELAEGRVQGAVVGRAARCHNRAPSR